LTSLGTAPVAFINHLLRGASWAPERLQPHAGRALGIKSGLVALKFRVTADGYLEPTESEAPCDVEISLPPAALLRLLAGDQAARSEARIEGDAQLAQVLSGIVAQISWDVEEDLSRFVGDIAAHRIADGARTLSEWNRNAVERFAQNLAEYWTEEDRLIASKHGIEEWVQEVDRLREDVDRLSKRIERLQRS
jgi:ubiquinone biosynthesis accessory factor UbiJ